VLGVLAIGSVVLFVASAVGVPFFIVRMPPDYFSRRERRRLGLPQSAPSRWWWVARISKNALGVLLLTAGVVMLVLPGQGVATLFVALLLLDFPGKRRLQRRIIAVPQVLRSLNRLRARAGQPPLARDELTRGRS
jgi:hypothetical protein